MRYDILLKDGTRVIVDGETIRHIGLDGKELYSYSSSEAPFAPDEKKVEMVNSYFFQIGDAEREKVAIWLNNVPSSTEKQKRFLDRVEFALTRTRVPFVFKIATLEPSLSEDGKIFYEEGQRVGRGISYAEWDKAASAFYSDSEWYSALALPEEGDLFIAYRVAMGMWSFEYVCDDSSNAGNFWDSPTSSRNFELSGARIVGGFKDGTGNTLKIFKDDSTFITVGGEYIDSGVTHPISSIHDIAYNATAVNYRGCGVVVLRKR